LALAVLDLDHFKSVNDTYGHEMGDLVLRKFGGLLRVSFREHDVAARIGGEEFLVAAYSATQDSLAQRLRQTLRKLMSKRFESGGRTFAVSFSAGVVEFIANKGDFDSLYRAADALLYRAKQEGRQRIVTDDRSWLP
jgi:two-component system cell cycle response regulator